MENYKKMCAILCAAISDTLELLPGMVENLPARTKLEQAMLDAEELYLADDAADA